MVHGEPSEPADADKVFKAGTPSGTASAAGGRVTAAGGPFCKGGCIRGSRRVVGHLRKIPIGRCKPSELGFAE